MTMARKKKLKTFECSVRGMVKMLNGYLGFDMTKTVAPIYKDYESDEIIGWTVLDAKTEDCPLYEDIDQLIASYGF